MKTTCEMKIQFYVCREFFLYATTFVDRHEQHIKQLTFGCVRFRPLASSEFPPNNI